MSRRTSGSVLVMILSLVPGLAQAQHGSGGHGGGMHGGGFSAGGGHHHQMPGAQLAAVSGGYFGYGWPAFVAGPGYFVYYDPYVTSMGPGGYFRPIGPVPPAMPMRGPLLGPPPRQMVPPAQAAKPVASDPKRAQHYVTLGDRLLRAGNLKRAEDRYLQARAASPDQAAPHLRLAELALVRGQYRQAADHLRDAETAEPGWVIAAPDIQSLFGEPGQFLGQLARLESHVQSHPDDRDAWLVLGAQWFLSGRTARAADVFARLDDPDRKPDVALAAFLFASEHGRTKPGEAGQAPR